MYPFLFLLFLPFLSESEEPKRNEILTKREVLIKLNDLCEESRSRMKNLENEGLDESNEFYQELGFYQGVKEAIYIVKFIKTS